MMNGRMSLSRIVVRTALPFVLCVLGVLCVLFFNFKGSAFSADNLQGITAQQHQQLGWMEEALLGASHPGDSPKNRLSELEQSIFGHSNPQQSITERLMHLDKALLARKKAVEQANGVNMGPAQIPSGNAQGNPQPKKYHKTPVNIENTAYSNPEPKKHSTGIVNPQNKSVRSKGSNSNSSVSEAMIVDQMEQRIFRQSYAGEPLVSRLTRLELSVMGYQQTGNLSARTDNLRWLVFGAEQQPDALTNPEANSQKVASQNQGKGQAMAPPQHYLPDPAAQQPAIASAAPIQGQPGQTYTGQTYGQAQSAASMADMQRALATIEKQELRTSYPMDPIPVRLGRLEQKIFNQTAENSGYSDEERLQRIIAVSAAEKDSVASRGGNSGGIKSMWPLLPILVLMLL